MSWGAAMAAWRAEMESLTPTLEPSIRFTTEDMGDGYVRPLDHALRHHQTTRLYDYRATSSSVAGYTGGGTSRTLTTTELRIAYMVADCGSRARGDALAEADFKQLAMRLVSPEWFDRGTTGIAAVSPPIRATFDIFNGQGGEAVGQLSVLTFNIIHT